MPRSLVTAVSRMPRSAVARAAARTVEPESKMALPGLRRARGGDADRLLLGPRQFGGNRCLGLEARMHRWLEQRAAVAALQVAFPFEMLEIAPDG